MEELIELCEDMLQTIYISRINDELAEYYDVQLALIKRKLGINTNG